MYKPIHTKKPNTISNTLMRLLKKRGSIRETKKAPVLIVTNATETLETLIAEKKNTQCRAMRIPVPKNFAIPMRSTLKDFLDRTK